MNPAEMSVSKPLLAKAAVPSVLQSPSLFFPTAQLMEAHKSQKQKRKKKKQNKQYPEFLDIQL